jgi:DNA-binding XRE family transcriptional regulator
MANLAKLLKDEILRLARKAVKQETAAGRKAAADHRRQIARLRRELTSAHKRLATLEKRRPVGRPATGIAAMNAMPLAGDRQTRFSPVWLKKHRAKLGISAADYAKLIGVSPLSVYNWEHGKTKPRAKQVELLASIRGLGRREVLRRLDSSH